MQSATASLTGILKQDAEINTSARLIAEWNQNRYSIISSITNDGIEDYDPEMFPIETIAAPNRPTYRGIVKARASSAQRSSSIGADGFTTSGYRDVPYSARYVTCSIDSKYKYWSSPYESVGTYSPSAASISGCAPTINYSGPTKCNKIVVKFESSYARPTQYSIQITTNGTTWTTVDSNRAIPDSGVVAIYHQGLGVWSATQNLSLSNAVNILGVKLVVTQMNKAQVFFNLIELSARLETDISDHLISFSVNNTMSNPSFITPLGTSSSNVGSVVLSNTDMMFTNDNPLSPYYDLLDKNVEFRLDVGINLGTVAAPNYEWKRQLTMKTDEWEGQGPDETTVSLVDSSAHLQSIKPSPTFYQSMTIGEVIWRLLDSVGFVDYQYASRATDPSTLIPFFWTDGTKTIWEVFNELAQPTQTAIYFDQFNVLQIQTRDAAYDLSKPVAWALDAVPNGTKLPDISKLDKTADYEANVVNILYIPTSVADDSKGVPLMETVWEPGSDNPTSSSMSSDVVLRAVPLVTSFGAGDLLARFSPARMVSWPYQGIIQIEGEFIRYVSKGYVYYNESGTAVYTWIKSADEKVALDKKNPYLSYKNGPSGYLNFGTLANRAIWNTVAKAHAVEANGYLNRSRTLGGSVVTTDAYFMPDPYSSNLRLHPSTAFTPNSWYVCTRGSSSDVAPKYFGTSLKFSNSGYSFGAAGLAISVGTNDEGYYVELMKTSLLDGSVGRTLTNELCFYVKYSDGRIVRMGPNGGKGNVLNVTPEKWYDIDVAISSTAGGNYTFSIYVNGVPQMDVTVPSAQRVGDPLGGRFGVFTRGNSWANYEYLYASTYGSFDAFDEEGYFDRIEGGYQSSQMMNEWVYSMRSSTRIVKGRKIAFTQKYNQTIIDEFGPIAHEVREFDVKFSKSPVLHSRLYVGNDTMIICPEYNGNAFGAKFVLANTARVDAIVNGEDTLTYGIDNPLAQHLLIYGRMVIQDSEARHTVTSDLGVRRRGEVSIDVQSSWIQSEAAAKVLGEWIIKHWAGGADEVKVTIFGNPLLQLGDLVSVNYPAMNMASNTHKYFIVDLNQSYNNGLSTDLKLRRAKV